MGGLLTSDRLFINLPAPEHKTIAVQTSDQSSGGRMYFQVHGANKTVVQTPNFVY